MEMLIYFGEEYFRKKFIGSLFSNYLGKVVFKPTATISKKQETLDKNFKPILDESPRKA